ncbi:MAG: hypothetical protein ABI467_07355 [Kofleriaceae bacterium]
MQTGTRAVPDITKIAHGMLAAGLLGALAYGNYECFGPGCGTGAKVAVGVADGAIVIGAVAFVVAMFVIAGHAD